MVWAEGKWHRHENAILTVIFSFRGLLRRVKLMMLTQRCHVQTTKTAGYIFIKFLNEFYRHLAPLVIVIRGLVAFWKKEQQAITHN